MLYILHICISDILCIYAHLAYYAYIAYITYYAYFAYLTFYVDSTTKVSTVSPVPDAEDSGTPSASAKKARRKTNSDGLPVLLTQSGRVSMASNEVNVKFDSSYRSSENTVALLGRRLTLGQACGIIGVALYGPDIIPLEDSGI